MTVFLTVWISLMLIGNINFSVICLATKRNLYKEGTSDDDGFKRAGFVFVTLTPAVFPLTLKMIYNALKKVCYSVTKE